MRAADLLNQHFHNGSSTEWQQSGCYEYRLNSETNDVIEPWRMGIDCAGTRKIQSLRHSKAFKLLFTVDWQKSRKGIHCDLYWQHDNHAAIRACYRIENGQLRVLHTFKHLFSEKRIDLEHDAHFFPLLRIFSGDMLRHIQGNRTPVLLPDIEPELSAEEKLTPRFDLRASTIYESDNKSETYKVTGGHYTEDNALFKVDNDGILQFYQWQQSDTALWTISNHQC